MYYVIEWKAQKVGVKGNTTVDSGVLNRVLYRNEEEARQSLADQMAIHAGDAISAKKENPKLNDIKLRFTPPAGHGYVLETQDDGTVVTTDYWISKLYLKDEEVK